MSKIDLKISDIDRVICENIGLSDDIDRGLLSQNILAQLRNFVEQVSLKAYSSGNDIEINYGNIELANAYVKTRGELNFLSKFHKLLQISASHYTLDGNGSERLMLKYYEYLLRIKQYLKREFSINVLANIQDFPIDLDPSMGEYHRKISGKIDSVRQESKNRGSTDRYYINKVRPFFVDEQIYYEVTFSAANDRSSKFDRVIAFTSIDIFDNYAAKLTLVDEFIDILGKSMPIKIIDRWEVSIRPCEWNNFARIFNEQINIQTSGAEYRDLMGFLSEAHFNLVELIDSPEPYYLHIKELLTENTKSPRIFLILDKCRELSLNGAPGGNVVRYLLLRLCNKIIKQQYWYGGCEILSNLNLKYGCIPFDQMPFNSSLISHNPKVSDLFGCIEIKGRECELLARRIKNNVEYKGRLYTPTEELSNFENLNKLIGDYNKKLYYKHGHRRLQAYSNNIYIKGYEDDTLNIIKELKLLSSTGVEGYANSVESWLKTSSYSIDSAEKIEALRLMFESSRVSLIYGAAGTGKSTMINHISNYLHDKSKLYLANTNPAVDNLKRRVSTSNCTFRTIARHLLTSGLDREFDVLVIDECSTVSNADMLEIINKTTFKLLVLVGDVYQIESILFGNWFSAIRFFLPKSAVFELTEPYRTSNSNLLDLWSKVRNIEDDIIEHITRNGYSANLDESIFHQSQDDEIILCLNYDGLYGINNVNRFLQSSNQNPPIHWGVYTYKVGDPILFNELERFKPIIYNNLKGKIVDISKLKDGILFDVEIDRAITQLDVEGLDLEWVNNSDDDSSIVRFEVCKNASTDEDDDSLNTIVPFQVAYAISIHKAQGLEYGSVKIVITDEVDEAVTHNIFYTAITRARDQVKIYWTPEVEKKIISSLEHKLNRRDVGLLSAKFGLTPDWSAR